MFLKKIKLAGFKSFVDPTTLTFPGRLSAVVGPNGSGKSNIIDAVSWVLGENSMKYLRGDVLTDVIFNGSTARKPVGQASIELVFDNQGGAIGGEYSQYAEISIKRSISRDSDSLYYLNNSVCRRRDILDIFSGTGLGPRSYSIIGQNMVSRIIESKPDDLRVYLEEAAGISKYKERRRETELRIQHTKDNVSRVNDLRAELDRQLGQLKRQASDAERYKMLKQQERLLKSHWYGIQWRQLDAQLVQYTLHIQQKETAQEGCQSQLVETETLQEKRRQEQRTASDTFQEVQRRYYTIGNEIARIEQDIVHQQERQQQGETDLKQVSHDYQEQEHQLQEVKDEWQELISDVAQLEPEWKQAVALEKHATQTLVHAEEASGAWQSRWDGFHQQSMKVNQQVEVERTRIQHLQQKHQTIKYQRGKIEQEQTNTDFSLLSKEISEFSEQSDEVKKHIEEHEQQLEDVKKDRTVLQAERQRLSTQLDETRSILQQWRGKQASIEALQKAALGQEDRPVLKWLAQHQLDKNPRLAQSIEVEKGWEAAVEKVLGPYLQAVCVEKVDSIAHHITDLTEGQLLAFVNQSRVISHSSNKAPTLIEKVTSSLPVHSLLSGVYVSETVDEALALLSALEVNESVITRDGIWLSPTWFRVSHDKNPAAGVFQREQELKQLSVAITDFENKQKEMETLLGQMKEKLAHLDQQSENLQPILNQYHARAALIAAQHKAKQERLFELKRKAEHLLKEQKEYQTQEQQTEIELQKANEILQNAQTVKDKFNVEREELVVDRETVQRQLQESRQNAHSAKEQAHRLEIRLQSTKSQQGSLQHTIERMHTQLTVLAERKQTLENELSAVKPIDGLKEILTRTLDKHVTIETELNMARMSMEILEQELDKLGKQRHAIEQSIVSVRNELEHLRLESQGLRLKAEMLQESLKEMECILEEILKELPQEAVEQEYQAQHEKVVQKISRLGSINLIAVEEYATCQERKQYLDKQHEDLDASLNTLGNAIAKIDRETRTRFKETFDKINQRFQELFPQVFGGGHAVLEMTDENLLDTGVVVMACPPGKRNSSIHLLSGGEKTMTALALIFSIFYLNPSPLCLLDEVDAALDDLNVSRFCELVKKMSEKTQFIFISHNKLAIEMAEYLMGITMHEPGVSRLVSVDIQEALSMASA